MDSEAPSAIKEEFEAEGPSTIGHKNPQLRRTGSPVRPSSTTNTYLPVSSPLFKPDLTLYCRHCDQHIPMTKHLEHRKYHQALTILGYSTNPPTLDLDDVVKRRKLLIERLKTNGGKSSVDITNVHRINESFDTIRSYLDSALDVNREFADDVDTSTVSGTALDCSCQCVLTVGICSDQNARYKSQTEDRKVYQDYFGNDAAKVFFGIYDGHHGHYAAEVAANELHHLLLEEMVRFDPTTRCTCTVNMVADETSSDYAEHRPYSQTSERVILHQASTNMVQTIIHTCEVNLAALLGSETITGTVTSSPFAEKISQGFVKSFHEVDGYLSLGLDEHSRVRWSGCSALCLLVRDVTPEPDDPDSPEPVNEGADPPRQLGEIYLAQAGNVRALLVRDNKPHKLTRDHTLNNPKERNRVLKNGGIVSGSDREMLINGVMVSTRGLGNHGDPHVKRCVTVDPYTTTLAIDQYAQFIVMASNGLWQVFSDQDVATIVGQLLPCNLIPPPSHVDVSVQPLLQSPTMSPTTGAECSGGERTRDTAPAPLVPEHNNSTDEISQHTDHEGETGIEGEAGLYAHDDLRSSTGTSRIWNGSAVITDNHPQEPTSGESDHLAGSSSVTSGLAGNSSVTSQFARDQLRRDLAKEMAERLVHAAILAGSKDNITVIVILLPGSGL